MNWSAESCRPVLRSMPLELAAVWSRYLCSSSVRGSLQLELGRRVKNSVIGTSAAALPVNYAAIVPRFT